MLHARILQTLKLFALQDAGVTLLELYKFLVNDVNEVNKLLDSTGEMVDVPSYLDADSVTLYSVLQMLDSLKANGQVVEARGFYTLVQNSDLLEARWLGYRFGHLRERRIKKYIGGLKYIPFIRGVGLAGSQALGLQRADSDIDLLIITSPGWIWLPRTLITGFFQIFGVRRHGNFVAHRFCLNHYIAGPKKMPHGRNWYTALEYGKLRPLVYPAGIAEFQVNNTNWLRAFFPNFSEVSPDVSRRSLVQRALEHILDNSAGAWIERQFKKWQIKRIRLSDRHTIAAGDELFFSPHSKEDKVLPAFLKYESNS